MARIRAVRLQETLDDTGMKSGRKASNNALPSTISPRVDETCRVKTTVSAQNVARLV